MRLSKLIWVLVVLALLATTQAAMGREIQTAHPFIVAVESAKSSIGSEIQTVHPLILPTYRGGWVSGVFKGTLRGYLWDL